MKKIYLSILLVTISTLSSVCFAQSENDTPLLGLPGDDLDLYAVLDLFQKSKTIEDFEKSLNNTADGIVNLDLNNDGNVDFIKVVTEQDGNNFLFILQDPINEKETQDVAVISVAKDDDGKVYLQIIGDEALYGKDYVVEPRTEPTASVTPNPAYTGKEPVTVNVEANTEVIVVEAAPVVQYVYSPAYVPYYPAYYYGFYPPYWRPIAVMSIAIYRHNHWYHHHHYHGGYGHRSVHVHHHHHYNNYNRNSRRASTTVNNNIQNGNFKTAGQRGAKPVTTQNGGGSNRASNGNRASTQTAKSQAGRTSNNVGSSNRATNNRSTAPSTTQRSTSPSTSNRSSASRSMGAYPSSSAGRSFGGRMGGGRRR
ncbi:hypothetical protein [Algibacter mikhailovii]|uniref:DUF3300 domain-containing protein n=1 Tax=Algibacter mikhailovii TaxID=425498 RepID=A0A918R2T0_9FLAO|nr:hypothetical protein [Algibacter mikhailovii]GGZ80576.1 hypothetical protein GCM10007028_17410 [Algibacter mikhailovii]